MLKRARLFLIINFLWFSISSSAYSADLYVRSGGGDFNVAATWSLSSNGPADGTVPTAADNVFLNSFSGNLTITAVAVCRSINCTGYTGTITQNGFTLSIGDGTAGASNIALKFVSTMNYVYTSVSLSEIRFVSTNATVQSVSFADKTTGNVTYDGVAGSWKLINDHNTANTGVVTLTNGTLDANGETFNWGLFSSNNANARTLNLNAATVNIIGVGTVWDVSSSLTLSALVFSTLNISNSTAAAKTFAGGGLATYKTVIFSGDNITVTGSNTFYELRAQNAGLPNGLLISSGTIQNVTSFTTNGYASNLSILKTTVLTSVATLSKLDGTVMVDYMSITDISATTSGTAVWIASSSSLVNSSGWTTTKPTGRYWIGDVNGNGNWSVGSNWAPTSGGLTDNTIPTATDNVFFDSNSKNGTVTIDDAIAGGSVEAYCRSINSTGYSGTILHGAGVNLRIGNADVVPGAGNIALKFDLQTTYTLGDIITSSITFISTASIVQTVDFAGKTTGAVSYNAVGGSWKLVSTHNTNFVFGANVNLQRGTLNTNNQSCNWGGFSFFTATGTETLAMGSSAIVLKSIKPLAFQPNILAADTATMVIAPNSAVISIIAAGSQVTARMRGRDFNGLSLVHQIDGSAQTNTNIFVNAGTCTLRNLTVTSAEGNFVGIDDLFQINGPIIVTEKLSLNGYSFARRLRVSSNASGSVRTITVTGAKVNCSYVDFRYIGISPAINLSSIQGGSGDLGDNVGITFTTGAPLYWYSNATGVKLWSEVSNWYLGSNGSGGNANRIPLPQDSVIFDRFSFGAASITLDSDVPRIGGNINWSDITIGNPLNNPIWKFSSNVVNFGSLTLASNLTMTAFNGAKFYLAGYTTGTPFSLTSDSIAFPHSEVLLNTSLYFNYSVANVFNLNDSFNGNSSNTTIVRTNGVVNLNNQNVTTGSFISGNTGTITMGSGLLKLTGSGTVWSCVAGVTFNTNTSVIELSNNTTDAQSFAGGGKTYNKIKLSGNTGESAYTFSGGNTFTDFEDAKTCSHELIFTASTTTTFTNSPTFANGSNFLIITSTSPTLQFTWSSANAVTCNYIVLSKSAAVGGVFTPGVNSIDGGGNTGWQPFTAQDFIWTGAVDNNWSTTGNWQGTGGVPHAGSIAYFIGTPIRNCTIDSSCNCLGIFMGVTFTGSITQGTTMNIGASGFEINGGTFLGSTDSIINTGKFILTGGTFTGGAQTITNLGLFRQTSGYFTSTSSQFEVKAQGSGVDTFFVSATAPATSKFISNSGSFKISGTLDARINLTSYATATNFNNLELNTSGVVSGTFTVDGNLTRSATLSVALDADITLKGNYLAGAGAINSSAGSGWIRFNGTGSQSFTYPYAPNVQVNKASGVLDIPANINVGSNWSHSQFIGIVLNLGTIQWTDNSTYFSKVTFDNVTSGRVTISNGSFYEVDFAKNSSDEVVIVGSCAISKKLTISSLANLNGLNIELSGDLITNVATPSSGTSKIIFKGSTAATIDSSVNPSYSCVSLDVKKSGSTLTLNKDLNIYSPSHDLNVIAGTLNLNNKSLTVADNFTVYDKLSLKGGDISVFGSTILSSNSHFTLSATSSTIIYTGASNATVTDLSHTFYNLTLGASKIHEFATGSGNGITVNGSLASNGTNTTRSTLRSVADANINWELTLNGTSTLSNKVNVKRSDASTGLGVLAVGSISSGNNTKWVGLVSSVTSITSSKASGNYTIGETIPVTINFIDSITLTGTLSINLNSGGVVTINNFTGTNATGTYTVLAGHTSADLTATSILITGTVTNSIAGSLDTSIPSTNIGTAKDIVIDTAVPTITGVNSSTANGSYKVGDTISIQITCSTIVNVTGTPVLTLETGTTDRTINYVSGSGSTTLVFSYTVQSGDTSLDLDYTGTSALALGGGSIKNLVGTNVTLTLPTPGNSGSLGANKAIVIDNTAPTVTSVSSSTADGNYNAGDTILITVLFSEAVAVTGAPTITLETGTTDRTATYASGSGTTTLVFSYTVQSDDMASDLDYTSTTALALSSGTIKDAALNDATLTLATPGATNSLGASKAIVIDTTIPVVLSVSSSTSDGIYKAGSLIAITVTFSKVVNVAGVPTLTLETGTTDRNASYASGSGSTVLVFNYTVQSGDISSDLDYVATSSLSLAGGSINDDFLNAATLTLASPGSANSLGDSKAILIDTIAPTFASQSLDAGFTFIDITFSEPVYTASGASGGLASTDFSLIFAKNGGTATGVTIASVTTTSGSATLGGETTVRLNLTVAGVIAGTETFSIIPASNAIFDSAGNTAPTTTTTGTLNISDDVGPTVTNVTSTKDDGAYKAGEEISIQVVFSEVVTVSGIPTLSLETGSTDQSVNYASGSGTTTLTFTYTVQSGNTSADLEYQSTSALALNGGSILDVASNAATLTLPTLGATGSLGFNKAIVIDTTVPTIVSTTLSPNNDFVDVTFSEAVYTTSGSGAIIPADFGIEFSVNGGTATGVSITSILSTSETALVGGETTIRIFIAVAGTVSGKETITVKALADSIFDLVGNALAEREISGTLKAEGGIDTGTSGGSGGGCQYAPNANHQNAGEWVLILLVLVVLPMVRYRRSMNNKNS